VIETSDYFQRAQERAQEEKLRENLEKEISARQALELLFDGCFDELAEAEYQAELSQKRVVRIRKIVSRQRKKIIALSLLIFALLGCAAFLLYYEYLVFVPR